VADLDLVRSSAHPELLAAIHADERLHRAVITPVVVPAAGPGVAFASPAAWWLRQELFGGRLWAAPSRAGAPEPVAPGLVDVLPPAPPALRVQDLDAELCRALGGAFTWADVAWDRPGWWDPATLDSVLERLADEHLTIGAADLLRWWRLLAELQIEPDGRVTPRGVRVITGLGTTVVPARDAVVVHDRMHLQLRGFGAQIWARGALAGERLAALFGVDLVQDRLGEALVDQTGCGGPALLPPAAREVLDAAGALDVPWCEHDDLQVAGAAVDWWLAPLEGTVRVHACTTDGLAEGIAAVLDRPDLLEPLAAVLADPQALAAALAELEIG
jgi:hypothetical protein